MKKWPHNLANNTKETLYNAIYGTKANARRYFGVYSGNKNVSKNLEVANSVRNVHLISKKFLNNQNLDKNRWANYLSPKQAAFKITKPVPIIAFKGGKYIGHIWREGASPANTGSDTANFIGIQKTLDPSVSAPGLGKILIKQTEKELGALGYKKMQTFPRPVMSKLMNNLGGWSHNYEGFRIKNISNQGN